MCLIPCVDYYMMPAIYVVTIICTSVEFKTQSPATRDGPHCQCPLGAFGQDFDKIFQSLNREAHEPLTTQSPGERERGREKWVWDLRKCRLRARSKEQVYNVKGIDIQKEKWWRSVKIRENRHSKEQKQFSPIVASTVLCTSYISPPQFLAGQS